MADSELLMHFAEIAGIFVGFGALIAIRSEPTRDEEVTVIRQLVVLGIVVVVVAILPVILSRFGVTGHGLWASSAGVFLVVFWGSSILNHWDVERTRYLTSISRSTRMRFEMPLIPLWGFMSIALILIITGRFPGWEAAVYVASVAAALFLTAGTLLVLVYLQRRPQTDASTATTASTIDSGTGATGHDADAPSETRDRRRSIAGFRIS